MNDKRVSFSKIAEVVLIPERNEYESFKETLWYNFIDFIRFKNQELNRVRLERVILLGNNNFL